MSPNRGDMGLTAFESHVLEALSEIREDCKTRLTALEQHDRECYGNGQPGWKDKHEKAISWLQRVTYFALGGAGVLWGIVKLVVH